MSNDAAGMVTMATAERVIALPALGSPAPAFVARTTMGERSLEGFRGGWLVFFAHPADFTAVCTSEIVAFAKAEARFAALGCALLGLSVDSLYSHLAWVESLRERFGVEIGFPIVEDPSMAIARAYGMLGNEATSSATVRATFVIDPQGIIRAMTWYPVSTGRSIDEILRLVAALQEADAEAVQTPADWQPGEPGIAPTPVTVAEIEAARGGEGVVDWYYRRVTNGQV
jgi:peroxiredoxin 2/4